MVLSIDFDLHGKSLRPGLPTSNLAQPSQIRSLWNLCTEWISLAWSWSAVLHPCSGSSYGALKYTKLRKMIATVVWCSFSSELCCENVCCDVIGRSQGIRAPARPLWCTCQVHKVAWLHDFHEIILLRLWVPSPLQPDEARHPKVIHVLKSLSLLHLHFLWRASRASSPALFVHGSWLKYRERKAACFGNGSDIIFFRCDER